jgi:Na+-driven multidrug efflux pump
MNTQVLVVGTSSASRVLSFVAPALWLAALPDFQLIQLWYVSVASTTLQAVLSLWLVRGEFRRRAPVPAMARA